MATPDRLATATTLYDVNILDAMNEYLFKSAQSTLRRTADRSTFQKVTNAATPVRNLPENPVEGQRIQPLNDITAPGGAVLTAAEATGSGAGLYTGYLIDGSYTVGTGDLGSLLPANTNFAGLLSYSPATGNVASFRNRTVWQDAGSAYNPTASGKVTINGVDYAITDILGGDYWALTGADGSLLKAGQKYFVNVENGSGTKLYPDKTLTPGNIYFFDGLTWIEEKVGLDQSEVDARVKSLVEDFAEVAQACPPGITAPCPKYSKPCWIWTGTESEHTAISPKRADVCYVIPETSQ